MNRRINKILLDVLHEKEESLVNYAKLFKVSEQTIRNDIKEINFQLESSEKNEALYFEDGYLKIPKEVDLLKGTISNVCIFSALSFNPR